MMKKRAAIMGAAAAGIAALVGLASRWKPTLAHPDDIVRTARRSPEWGRSELRPGIPEPPPKEHYFGPLPPSL